MKIYFLMSVLVGCAFFSNAGGTNLLTPLNNDPYNEAVLAKISTRWFLMMDSPGATPPRIVGKATLEFKILQDGSVKDLKLDKSNVQAQEIAVCQEAILDSAPFARWTNDASLHDTNGYRAIRYTFNFK